MNEKYEKLKKSLIGHGIRSAVIVIGCVIGLAASYYFYSNSQYSIKKLTRKDNQLKSQISQIKLQNERAENTLTLYKKLVKDSTLKSLELNRQSISTMLNKLSAKYKINNLSINIDRIKERKEEPFLQKTGTIITTTISLNFDSSSDVHSFAFVDELLNKFSGYLNFKSFSVQRDRNFSEAVIRELLKGGRTNFIRTSVQFDWLGLRPKADKKTEGGS